MAFASQGDKVVGTLLRAAGARVPVGSYLGLSCQYGSPIRRLLGLLRQRYSCRAQN